MRIKLRLRLGVQQEVLSAGQLVAENVSITSADQATCVTDLEATFVTAPWLCGCMSRLSDIPTELCGDVACP